MPWVNHLSRQPLERRPDPPARCRAPGDQPPRAPRMVRQGDGPGWDGRICGSLTKGAKTLLDSAVEICQPPAGGQAAPDTRPDKRPDKRGGDRP